MTDPRRPGHDATRRNRGALLVWAVTAVTLIAIGVTGWLEFETGLSGDSTLDRVEFAIWGSSLSMFVVSGAIIVSRQPRNVIGWLLMIPGLSVPLSDLPFRALVDMDPAPVVARPLLWLAVWFTGWSWILLIFPLFHLLLTFPSGRLLSRRWRWTVWLELAMIATMVGLVAFSRELVVLLDETVVWSVPNPIGFVEEEFFNGPFEPIWTAALLLLTIASVSAFVIRFRRASSVERQQFKWLLFAVALFGLVYAALAIPANQAGGVIDLLFALSVGAIPVAVAIGVLRYRLYEIDRIISRTVGYLLVVALLGALFFAVVTTLGSVFPAESPLAVAGSTLAVAALFNPLRRRVQEWVDRRFNRARYDAQRVMERFAGSLQGRLDHDGVVDGWVGVVAETMQPASVAVWVREE
ncbi:MAG TPA: hypothetical protein VLA91_15875 [Acidimicrobiia bacterium]|nr:hypothetical protein [Acidimicrobiia bacterium]